MNKGAKPAVKAVAKQTKKPPQKAAQAPVDNSKAAVPVQKPPVAAPRKPASWVRNAASPGFYTVGSAVDKKDAASYNERIDWKNVISDSAIENMKLLIEKPPSANMQAKLTLKSGSTGQVFQIKTAALVVAACRLTGLGVMRAGTTDKSFYNHVFFSVLKKEAPPTLVKENPTIEQDQLKFFTQLHKACTRVLWYMFQSPLIRTDVKNNVKPLARANVANARKVAPDQLNMKDPDVQNELEQEEFKLFCAQANVFFNGKKADRGSVPPKKPEEVDSLYVYQDVWLPTAGTKKADLQEATKGLNQYMSEEGLKTSPQFIYDSMIQAGWRYNQIQFHAGDTGVNIRTTELEKLTEVMKEVIRLSREKNIPLEMRDVASRRAAMEADIMNFERVFVTDNYVVEALIELEPYCQNASDQWGVRIKTKGKYTIVKTGVSDRNMPMFDPSLKGVDSFGEVDVSQLANDALRALSEENEGENKTQPTTEKPEALRQVQGGDPRLQILPPIPPVQQQQQNLPPGESGEEHGQFDKDQGGNGFQQGLPEEEVEQLGETEGRELEGGGDGDYEEGNNEEGEQAEENVTQGGNEGEDNMEETTIDESGGETRQQATGDEEPDEQEEEKPVQKPTKGKNTNAGGKSLKRLQQRKDEEEQEIAEPVTRGSHSGTKRKSGEGVADEPKTKQRALARAPAKGKSK